MQKWFQRGGTSTLPRAKLHLPQTLYINGNDRHPTPMHVFANVATVPQADPLGSEGGDVVAGIFNLLRYRL
eukprot:1153295-Pyramimonas_sp.AAC.2